MSHPGPMIPLPRAEAHSAARPDWRANPLLSDPIRLPLEQAVSRSFGYEWKVVSYQDMNNYASHPSAILSDGVRAAFAKFSAAAHGQDQFEVEMAGLRLLSERAGVLTPAPIGIVPVDGGVLLILEAVETVERTPLEWREIGRTLARIHQVRGVQWGLEKQGYFGPLYQDNRPTSSWLEFFLERRLWPRLVGAIDSGSLPIEVIRQVERLIHLLPGLDIPEVEPCLLHGDAQQNNYISTKTGAVAIDPAVYYGNPEIDLAYVDYFEPVPEDVFHGYREIRPVDPGFAGRRELWRIPAYLAAVEVEGQGHLHRLVRALDKYT